ncbi:DNA processing protein DprA [Bifidobacterium aemilianum]|uniref:DNA processing protein DprA n=2 Tax=Bifidobacterium aemilianum TaxID=2493120 RepID=A0A366K8U5_9BIFI|nr:DNA processing protein DprA [Bifidobacterium aemilianum]
MQGSQTNAELARIDMETLTMALLTYCLDGADALMFACLKGADDPRQILGLLLALSGRDPGAFDLPAPRSHQAAAGELDRIFCLGLSRWGRSVNHQALRSLHLSRDRWTHRLDSLPSGRLDNLLPWLTAEGSQWIISPSSPYWPRQLADLSIRKDWAPPLCLWGQGDPGALVSCPQPMAIVGSRGCNDYGRQVAYSLGREAGQAGHLLVSGGALGSDASAHRGSLAACSEYGLAHAGRTVAVFAGGLNHQGPQSNLPLFETILAQDGALISELCPGTIPEPRRFLLRNRIIAALASVVVVAQARLRSGALNTANWAAELNREVYAAPGAIDQPANAGCNRLILEGKATILTSSKACTQICHEGHRPLFPQAQAPYSGMITPDQASGRRVPIDGTLVGQEGMDGDGTRQTNEPTARSPLAQAILAALRHCRRQKEDATIDRILTLSQRRMAEPIPIGQLNQELGLLEMEGAIFLRGGSISLATGSG